MLLNPTSSLRLWVLLISQSATGGNSWWMRHSDNSRTLYVTWPQPTQIQWWWCPIFPHFNGCTVSVSLGILKQFHLTLDAKIDPCSDLRLHRLVKWDSWHADKNCFPLGFRWCYFSRQTYVIHMYLLSNTQGSPQTMQVHSQPQTGNAFISAFGKAYDTDVIFIWSKVWNWK